MPLTRMCNIVLARKTKQIADRFVYTQERQMQNMSYNNNNANNNNNENTVLKKRTSYRIQSSFIANSNDRIIMYVQNMHRVLFDAIM